MIVGLSKKTVIAVLIEGIVVGICLLGLAKIISLFILTPPQTIDMDMIKVIFISGFLFHIIFEYTGLNLWYAVNYPAD